MRVLKILTSVLAVLLALVAARLYMTHTLERALLDRKANAPAAPALVSDAAIAVEDVTFEAGDERLAGRWMRPVKGTRRAVFIAHGGQPERLEHWALAQQTLAREGYASFVFDYAGFGASTGVATIDSMAADTITAFEYFAAGLTEEEPVALLGLSGGCAQLLRVMEALEGRAQALVLMSCFSSVRDYLHDSGRLREPWNRLLVPDVLDNVANAPFVAMPVLQIHGEADKIVSVKRARALHDALREPKHLRVIRGMKHNDPFERPGEEVWDVVAEFLDATL